MKCIICGKNAESEYCFQHKPRKRLTGKRNPKSDTSQMRDFFLSIWSKRPHRSEISGTYLGNEPLTIFFHHILPKERYEEAKFDEENIILLTLDEHTSVENNMYKYDKINYLRIKLKIKYGYTTQD